MAKRRKKDEPASGRIHRRGVEPAQDNYVQDEYGYGYNAGGLADLQAELDMQSQPAAVSAGSSKKTPRKHKRDRFAPQKRKRHILRKFILAMVGLLVVACTLLYISLRYTTRNDELWLTLEQVPYRAEGTLILYTDAATGEVAEYARLNPTQRRSYVSSGDIPQHVKDAFVAIEDKNFHKHSGVDLKRTIYAMLNELKHSITGSYIGGGNKQGASTITQQLIKNLTGDDEASGLAGYYRKIQEIYRAYKLDGAYTKDEILTAYLNVISFTNNTAGVQGEAQKLFGKNVGEVSIAEAASLAAITRSPSYYNPATNPEVHLERRDYILYEMHDQGLITDEEYAVAVATPLELIPQEDYIYEEPMTSYFTDLVMEAVRDELMGQRGLTVQQANDLLYNGGLRVYTTVVPQLQSSMEYVMENRLYFSGNSTTGGDGSVIYPQAAMVSLDYNGGVAAAVGGLGEKEHRRGLNRVNSPRQIGSTSKGIGPYVVAVEENKITWSSSFVDKPVRQVLNESTDTKEDWPRNVTGYYTEKDTLVVDAFAQSVNTIAVRVGDEVGYRKIYNFLTRDVGITTLTKDDRDAGPMALGSNTVGISPLEMAMAYSMFGTGGSISTTHCFTHIEGGNGTALLEVEVAEKQVVGDDTAYIMNRLMGRVMVGAGTGSGYSVAGSMESVGKTGTTSDYRDQWFVGLTPYYVTAVWYGYDENDAPLRVNMSSNPTILSWKQVMEQAQQGLEHKEFPTSGGVHEAAYCTTSGYKAGAYCPSATGYYKNGHDPEENCPVHG